MNGKGDAVSATCSLGSDFGSGEITSSGIVLNNGMHFLENGNKLLKSFSSYASPAILVDNQVAAFC